MEIFMKPIMTLFGVVCLACISLGLVDAGVSSSETLDNHETAPVVLQPEQKKPVNEGFKTDVIDSSVVAVRVRRSNNLGGWTAKTGTGVVLSNNRVITAKHLFAEPWTDVQVVFGGRGGVPEESVVWTPDMTFWIERDVVLLRNVPVPARIKPASVAAQPPNLEDPLMSIGLSSPSRIRLRVGHLMSIDKSQGLLNIDFNSSYGDSGGPTFNSKNEVVGIHVATGEARYVEIWGNRIEQYSTSVSVTDLPEIMAK
jgi:S1-C subfamily serine protease